MKCIYIELTPDGAAIKESIPIDVRYEDHMGLVVDRIDLGYSPRWKRNIHVPIAKVDGKSPVVQAAQPGQQEEPLMFSRLPRWELQRVSVAIVDGVMSIVPEYPKESPVGRALVLLSVPSLRARTAPKIEYRKGCRGIAHLTRWPNLSSVSDVEPETSMKSLFMVMPTGSFDVKVFGHRDAIAYFVFSWMGGKMVLEEEQTLRKATPQQISYYL